MVSSTSASPFRSNLHPAGRASHVRVSLHCRDGREALDRMRAIGYGAELICQKARTNGMRYDEVRELLRQYFADVLAEHKERVDQNGRISPFMLPRPSHSPR